jgi:8-oxo-dGTP pyrophosphatase MutT (NUDIX family)
MGTCHGLIAPAEHLKLRLHKPKLWTPDALRRQYAALPYRIADDVEVLLISSRESRRWVLPKGWPRKGRKPHAAAAQEALEEAGVMGKISKDPVGVYHYVKRMKNGSQQTCHVTVFPMRVSRQLKVWPEMHQRTARWFPLHEAAGLVGEPELQDVIRNFEASSEGKAAEAEAEAEVKAEANPPD